MECAGGSGVDFIPPEWVQMMPPAAIVAASRVLSKINGPATPWRRAYIAALCVQLCARACTG
ncbi:MAG TPA: hypothetical protein VGD54_06535, partial [Steroidobacteraceae bacterium]